MKDINDKINEISEKLNKYDKLVSTYCSYTDIYMDMFTPGKYMPINSEHIGKLIDEFSELNDNNNMFDLYYDIVDSGLSDDEKLIKFTSHEILDETVSFIDKCIESVEELNKVLKKAIRL